MNPEQIRSELAEPGFAAGLPERIVDQLAAHGEWLDVPGGTALFREGAPPGRMYVIRQGKVALDMNVPGRGPVRILTLGPGDMLAWSSLLGDEMTATATALEDVAAVAIDADRLRQLADEDHEFGYHLMRAMAEALARRLLATRLQLLDLFAETEGATPPRSCTPTRS